ncbi:MAG: preprotein translocase subunit SecE [Candidatus Dormibacteria bacterium]
MAVTSQRPGKVDEPRRPSRPSQGQARGRNVVTFFQETVAELQKVVWPEPRELWRMTLVVVATVVVIGVFIGVVDYVLKAAFTPIYTK